MTFVVYTWEQEFGNLEQEGAQVAPDEWLKMAMIVKNQSLWKMWVIMDDVVVA
jgi:hypothetical protein